MLKKILVTSLLFLLSTGGALAYYSPSKPTGYVNDYASMMSQERRIELENDLDAFEKETAHEIAIVTIESLDGDYIENFAVKLFEEWGIGKAEADNGVLFLVAKEDRQFRIEVGYGLEGALTDSISQAILDQVATPAFKQGDFDNGIVGAVEEIKKAIKGEELAVDPNAPSEESPIREIIVFYFVIFMFITFGGLFAYLGKSKRWWPGGLIGAIVGIVLGLILFSLTFAILGVVILGLLGLLFDWGASHKNWFKDFGKGGKGGGSSWGGSGGSSGGFGGFGGGSSGGGGASGGW